MFCFVLSFEKQQIRINVNKMKSMGSSTMTTTTFTQRQRIYDWRAAIPIDVHQAVCIVYSGMWRKESVQSVDVQLTTTHTVRQPYSVRGLCGRTTVAWKMKRLAMWRCRKCVTLRRNSSNSSSTVQRIVCLVADEWVCECVCSADKKMMKTKQIDDHSGCCGLAT